MTASHHLMTGNWKSSQTQAKKLSVVRLSLVPHPPAIPSQSKEIFLAKAAEENLLNFFHNSHVFYRPLKLCLWQAELAEAKRKLFREKEYLWRKLSRVHLVECASEWWMIATSGKITFSASLARCCCRFDCEAFPNVLCLSRELQQIIILVAGCFLFRGENLKSDLFWRFLAREFRCVDVGKRFLWRRLEARRENDKQ